MSTVRRMSNEHIWSGKCSNSNTSSNSGVISPAFYLQLPELLTTTQLNQSISSSGCPSDDSGIERTLNLSPSSLFPEDTDSDDAQSFSGFDINRNGDLRPGQRPFRNEVYRHHTSGQSIISDSAPLPPPVCCTAANKDEYHVRMQKPSSQKNRDNRFQILSYDQVTRLHEALCKTIPVHSRQPGFPTIWLTLSDLFRSVRANMKAAGIPIRDIRLNGGAASYVIGKDTYPNYNDIDILISVDLSSNSSIIQKVKSAVLDALISFIPDSMSAETSRPGINSPSSYSSLSTSQLEPSKSSPSPGQKGLPANKNNHLLRDFHLPLKLQSDFGGYANDHTHRSRDSSKLRPNQINSPIDDKLSSPSSTFSRLGDSPFISLEDLVCPQANPISGRSLYNSNLSFPNLDVNGQNPQSLAYTTNCPSSTDNMNLRESYVYKQFRKYSPDEDCWSLLSLGMPNQSAKVIELKFVDRMKRQFEFTVDSFQIVLDPLLMFYETNEKESMTPHYYPTVVAESVFGSFQEAFWHLQNKLIATKEPEMIRGGGLLKYCRLLVSGYKPAREVDVRSLERYMSSRFFIDFQDLNSQQGKLQSFLSNHFTEDEIDLKIEYLRTLYRVVNGSTVCLMSHEHFQILNLISYFLQHFMYRAQLKRTTLSLDWFAEKQNLVLDRIYLGNQLFPMIPRPSAYPMNNCCTCYCSQRISSPREQFIHIPDTNEFVPNAHSTSMNVNLPVAGSDAKIPCGANLYCPSHLVFQGYPSTTNWTAVT